MNSRDRFFKAVNHEQTDRPPIFMTLTPQMAQKLSDALKLPYEEPLDSLLSTRISHMDLLTHLGNDCVGIAGCAPTSSPTVELSKGRFRNEWGMVFEETGLYNEFAEFPLAHAETADHIKNYPWPDPMAAGRFDPAQTTINKYKKDYAVVADLETAFFETSWYLVGMEKFLMDLTIEEDYVYPLLDKVMHINTEIGKELIRRGADMLWAGDDFGTQHSMLIDPDTWRRVFKPRIKTMFEEFRKVKSDIKLAWHSCGAVTPIVPDFIEIGLDILNPIQPLAAGMEPKALKKEFGKDLTFFGGIDIQDLMPNGSPQQIKDEVKRRIEILSKNGGYIIAPAHNVQADTSVENVLAFF